MFTLGYYVAKLQLLQQKAATVPNDSSDAAQTLGDTFNNTTPDPSSTEPWTVEERIQDARDAVQEGDWSAQPDTAVFWSGAQGHADAEALHQADPHNATRITDTTAGQDVEALLPYGEYQDLGVSQDTYDEIWHDASDRFALAQQGNVRTFVESAEPERIFRSVEMDNLLFDERVTEINQQDKLAAIEAQDVNPEATFDTIVASEQQYSEPEWSWDSHSEVDQSASDLASLSEAWDSAQAAPSADHNVGLDTDLGLGQEE